MEDSLMADPDPVIEANRDTKKGGIRKRQEPESESSTPDVVSESAHEPQPPMASDHGGSAGSDPHRQVLPAKQKVSYKAMLQTSSTDLEWDEEEEEVPGQVNAPIPANQRRDTGELGEWMNARPRPRRTTQRREIPTEKEQPHMPVGGSRFEILRRDLDAEETVVLPDLEGINPWIRQAEETIQILSAADVHAALSVSQEAPGNKTIQPPTTLCANPKHNPPDLNRVAGAKHSGSTSKPPIRGIPVGRVSCKLRSNHGKLETPINIPTEATDCMAMEEGGDFQASDEEVFEDMDPAEGAVKPQFKRNLQLFCQQYKLAIVVVVEPRTSGRKASRIIASLGFPRSHRVEARGFSGGLWVLWRNQEVKVEAIISHAQFIHMRVWHNHQWFWLTAVYGSPTEAIRRALWRNIEIIASQLNGPWILAGDFNALLSTNKMTGGRHKGSKVGDEQFQHCVADSELIDLGFARPIFTWHRGSLMKRLDRALCNISWLQVYEKTAVFHLPFLGSDHRPLLIRLTEEHQKGKKPHNFHFQVPWITHEDFPRFVRENWKDRNGWAPTINSFSEKLGEWNHTVFGNIFSKKRKLLARLGGIQCYLEKKPSKFLSTLELELRAELDKILTHEETFWFQ
ncbi:hypothetical protein Tsubulata_010983 [Turnera subulata]|uniref:Endonuclease/exonuclease/phosphatase domain-containing protein n=1 Tax=Turnera subulata TaxID=218843 RepID=A0A9Q0G4B9_9ROSI|nr:hypothetical protein Tsubulata_010983 [Turnera subulata]